MPTVYSNSKANGLTASTSRGARGEKLGPTWVGNAPREADTNAIGHGFRSSFKDWARQHDVDELLSVPAPRSALLTENAVWKR